MKKVLQLFILWFILGALYFSLEGIWRIPSGRYANIIMLPIGGFCGVIVGGINQLPAFYHMKILYQSLIGATATLLVELSAGLALNIRLHLNIWDYSSLPGNIMGQICPQYALLWLLLMPFAIWVEDTLRWGFWQEGKPYALSHIYADFFSFR